MTFGRHRAEVSRATASDGGSERPLLRMEAISKAYPGVVANDDVSFDLRSGEIHALIGENGAGKSTLMAILFGLQRPDSGRILLDGSEVVISTPRDAIRHGIGFVQQHFSLIPTLTVLENIVLSRHFGAIGRSDRRFCLLRLQSIEAEYDLGIDPDANVEGLSVADQQKVELLKALILEPKILILDEPAALLSPEDVNQLNRILRRLAQRGFGIILIGHKLVDILSVADRISVLRRGRNIATLDAGDASPAVLGKLIVGDLKPFPERSAGGAHPAEPIFVVRNLCVAGERNTLAVEDVSLSLRSGEILGIAGVVGSGQIELMETIAGIRSGGSGAVILAGEDVTRLRIAARQDRGLALIPPDRHRDGLVGSLSIADNLAIRAARRQPRLSRWGMLRSRVVAERARQLVERFDIRGAGHQADVATLSGGNQQKTILARELDRDPKVMLCCYPTRGLDFAAANAVHAHLRRICDGGAAVIIASLDLDELFAVCDRIVVMQGGRLQGELRRGASEAHVGLMLGGETAPA
jgi:general nucleoside transport system ATP-binding protein